MIMENKRRLLLKILVAIVIVAGAGYWIFDNRIENQPANACSMNITALFLNASSSEGFSEEAVGRTIFDNLMNEYASMKDCPAVHIKDHRLNSFVLGSSTERYFIVDVLYDVKPRDIEDTGWTKMNGTVDGSWVRDIPMIMNIYRTGDGYFLSA